MTNSPAINAVAVIGLVALADGKTVLDMGTVARATATHMSKTTPPKCDGLELLLHGQESPMRLGGDDAAGIWYLLANAATPTKSLIPPPPAATNSPTVPASTPATSTASSSSTAAGSATATAGDAAAASAPAPASSTSHPETSHSSGAEHPTHGEPVGTSTPTPPPSPEPAPSVSPNTGRITQRPTSATGAASTTTSASLPPAGPSTPNA